MAVSIAVTMLTRGHKETPTDIKREGHTGNGESRRVTQGHERREIGSGRDVKV